MSKLFDAIVFLLTMTMLIAPFVMLYYGIVPGG